MKDHLPPFRPLDKTRFLDGLGNRLLQDLDDRGRSAGRCRSPPDPGDRGYVETQISGERDLRKERIFLFAEKYERSDLSCIDERGGRRRNTNRKVKVFSCECGKTAGCAIIRHPIDFDAQFLDRLEAGKLGRGASSRHPSVKQPIPSAWRTGNEPGRLAARTSSSP